MKQLLNQYHQQVSHMHSIIWLQANQLLQVQTTSTLIVLDYNQTIVIRASMVEVFTILILP